ncbi:MAG: PilZ domain-containing protein [Syntrophales bacterium]|nr:PilZ domain-containing protein [Syntrophales bacterium]
MSTEKEWIVGQPDNRREFCRVDASLPFTYRILTGEEAKAVPCRSLIFSGAVTRPSLPELDNTALGEWLKVINAKLDEIIQLLTLNQTGFTSLPFRPINISASGLCFKSDRQIEPGTIIEAQLILTGATPLPLFLVGEVVLSEKEETGYRTAMKFINIDESIRNDIIRFVFAREREILREKKGL